MSDIALTVSILALVAVVGLFIGNVKFRGIGLGIGGVLMLEDSYMPVKLFRNLSLQHLEGSKFEYIEQECGILIGGNYESLTPVLADRLLARQMKVAEHTPLLRITSLSYSESGEFLNYSVMFRNASEYQVEYHLRRLHPEKS